MSLNFEPLELIQHCSIILLSQNGKACMQEQTLGRESMNPMDLPKILSVSQICQASKTSRTIGSVLFVWLKV